MPSKRSGCRGPKLRSVFKVDDQTSRRRSLGESEIPEAVAILLRLAGFPGNVCPVGHIRLLAAPMRPVLLGPERRPPFFHQIAPMLDPDIGGRLAPPEI